MRTLIRGGLLVDPANRVMGKLNLLLDGGRVAAVTAEEPQAGRVIDAAGRVVCPGFVDIHMHEDPVGEDGHVRRSIFDAMLRMGVTTAVGGNCGINTYDPAAYLDIVERDGAPVNAWACPSACATCRARARRSFAPRPRAAGAGGG